MATPSAPEVHTMHVYNSPEYCVEVVVQADPSTTWMATVTDYRVIPSICWTLLPLVRLLLLLLLVILVVIVIMQTHLHRPLLQLLPIQPVIAVVPVIHHLLPMLHLLLNQNLLYCLDS